MTMIPKTVKELRSYLETFPDDMEIVVETNRGHSYFSVTKGAFEDYNEFTDEVTAVERLVIEEHEALY